jgi:hypothetical protein
MKTFHCCDCGRKNAHLARKRSVFERLVLPLFFLRPVRCEDCFRRQYVTVFCQLPRSPDRPQPPSRMAA